MNQGELRDYGSRGIKRLWDQGELRDYGSRGSKVSMKECSGVNKSVVNHLVNGRGRGGGLWNVFKTLKIMTDWFIVCSREVSEFYFNLWLGSVGREGGWTLYKHRKFRL